MKKIIPLILTCLLTCLFLASCGNPIGYSSSNSSNVESEPYTDTSQTSEDSIENIKTFFNSIYKDTEDYDFEIISTNNLNISLVKVSNPIMDKKPISMELGSRIIDVEATGEFSKLDLFVCSPAYIMELEKLFEKEVYSESTYSLIENISSENPNYVSKEVKSIKTPRIENINNYLSNENMFAVDMTEMNKSDILASFGLMTDDYVGAIYLLSNLYQDSVFAAFEYEADVQKDKIINGIEYYKSRLLSQHLFEKIELTEEEKQDEISVEIANEYNSQKIVVYNNNTYIDNEEFNYTKDSINNILVVAEDGLVVMVHELEASTYEEFAKSLILESKNTIENQAIIQEEALLDDKEFLENLKQSNIIDEEPSSEIENTED